MKNSVLRALGWGAAMCMLALVILCARSIAAIPTGAWGLHFSGDGAAPAGNAPKQALAKYDAVYLGDEDQKRIYLTFDAGYENGATEKILDALGGSFGTARDDKHFAAEFTLPMKQVVKQNSTGAE